MTSKHTKRSYMNLAEHYRRLGKHEQYEKYMKLAQKDANTPSAHKSIKLSNNRVPSELSCVPLDDLIHLYNSEKYETLIKLANNFPEHDILPYLASAIHFSQNNPAVIADTVNNIQDPEQRRLRIKTAEIWDTLHASLKEEPRVHLIILCHNREKHVENALKQLAATNYSNYEVYIADNGSFDKTWDILQEAVKSFPRHIKVKIERFPTNIGRPAGHNWLLTKHDHSVADYIAIGDDDLVEVPPDWLTRMVQTARAFRCAVVGGKALNPGKPDIIHGGIRNITQFSSDKLCLSNNDDQIDYGQFDYVDLVDHVIGCLHIYDRRILFDKIGLFDIRYSPCQFVDIDHHLRTVIAGYNIIFNGLIRFKHHRAMGRSAQTNNDLKGNSHGNIYKLLHKYDPKIVNKSLCQYRNNRNIWLNSKF